MKPQILIVDDEFFFADEIENVLKKNNFEVIGRAENEKEALEIIKNNKPNIIIMDIYLDPDDKSITAQEAGIHLAIKIQKTENVYIIFLTGRDSSDFSIDSFSKVKNSVFLKKPLVSDELIMNVRIASNFLSQFEEEKRDLVFISYCHKDKKMTDEMYNYLQILSVHKIKIWRDNHIEKGEVLDKMIDDAIAKTKVALLMISSHFLNSNYINSVELPKLIALYQAGKIKIIPIFLGDVAYEILEKYLSDQLPGGITSLLGLNDLDKPINRMKSSQSREEQWAILSKSLVKIMK